MCTSSDYTSSVIVLFLSSSEYRQAAEVYTNGAKNSTAKAAPHLFVVILLMLFHIVSHIVLFGWLVAGIESAAWNYQAAVQSHTSVFLLLVESACMYKKMRHQ